MRSTHTSEPASRDHPRLRLILSPQAYARLSALARQSGIRSPSRAASVIVEAAMRFDISEAPSAPTSTLSDEMAAMFGELAAAEPTPDTTSPPRHTRSSLLP